MPSLSISVFIDFLISEKTKIKRRISKIMFEINKYCRFCEFKSMKLLLINVKNVKKPTNRVIRNNMIIIVFFFKNSRII